MLRNILILSVSVFSLQTISYAADADNLMSDPASAAIKQSVMVINENEDVQDAVQSAVSSSTTAAISDAVDDLAETVKTKKTIGQKIKSFFANLFICLRATGDVAKEVAGNVKDIAKDVDDLKKTFGK